MIYKIIFFTILLISLFLVSFKKNKEKFSTCSSCITEIKKNVLDQKGDPGPRGNAGMESRNGYICKVCKACSDVDKNSCALGLTTKFSPIDVSTPSSGIGNKSKCAVIHPKVLAFHNQFYKTRVECGPAGPIGETGVMGEQGPEGEEGPVGEEGPIGPSPRTEIICRTCIGRQNNCEVSCGREYASDVDISRDCYDTGRTAPLFRGGSPERIYSKIVCRDPPDNIGEEGDQGPRGITGIRGPKGETGDRGEKGQSFGIKLNEDYYPMPDNITKDNTRWDVGRLDGDLEFLGTTDGKTIKNYDRSTDISNLPRYQGYVIPNILDIPVVDNNPNGPREHLNNPRSVCRTPSDCSFSFSGNVRALDYSSHSRNSVEYRPPFSIGKTYLSQHEFDNLKSILKYY